jgi:hypothetical protein
MVAHGVIRVLLMGIFSTDNSSKVYRPHISAIYELIHDYIDALFEGVWKECSCEYLTLQSTP